MTNAVPNSTDGASQDARQWAMFLHFSCLLGYVAPLVGFIAPFVIWQIKKDQHPWVDEHGKNAANWIISSLIYKVVSGILCFVFIGIPMLAALAVVDVLFPILAAIKASNGETWQYPLAIRFFR